MFWTLVTCDELVENGAIASPCWVDIGGKGAQPDWPPSYIKIVPSNEVLGNVGKTLAKEVSTRK